LFDRRQLHHHPCVDHARPCNQGHQVKSRQEASAELDKSRGSSEVPSRSCDNLALKF
jgi:hypothetical protein